MPAPLWFVEFFKVVGFVLHMIPMGIWFAGLPVAILCALANTPNSRRFADRLFSQLPIFMALGINFGIVPLLFLQTTYYKSFYTATILTAWHWIAVIPILIVGYYSLYLAAFSRVSMSASGHVNGINKRMIGFGVLASLCLIAIGMLMTNGLSLMVRSDLWPGIMEKTNYFGATTGLANNMRDPALWLRLATMFSLGLMTTGVWAVVDSQLFFKSQSEEEIVGYRSWTYRLGAVLALVTVVFLTGVEGGIKSGRWGDVPMTAYPFFGYILIPTMAVMGLFCLSWFVKVKRGPFFSIIVALHILTLAGFGILRQIGQNAGVASFDDVTKIPLDVQWTPLIAFLVAFVLGLVCIGWMVKQCVYLKEENAGV